MGKPTLKYVDDSLGDAIAGAMYETYVKQASRVQRVREPAGIRSQHGKGALMARFDDHGAWVIVAHQWGSRADVPQTLITRALEIYREIEPRFGGLVSRDEVSLIIRLAYTRSQSRASLTFRDVA